MVIFITNAVALVSSNRTEISADDREYRREIRGTITKKPKGHIDLEVCLAGVNYFVVDLASIQTEVRRVLNRLISKIGYQAKRCSPGTLE